MVSVQKRSFIKKKLEKLLLSALYPWADGVVAISTTVAEDIIQYARLVPAKVHVIYNPVITPDLLNKPKADSGNAWLQQKTSPSF